MDKYEFPVVKWNDKYVSFRPGNDETLPEGNRPAALVFAFHNERIVLADIAGRGWCIPGGRIEPGETARAAAVRETYEECGAVIDAPTPIGRTVSLESDRSERALAVSFVARVLRLDPMPEGFEARGIAIAAQSELPGLYYRWDGLMAAMFDYAWSLRPDYSFHSTAVSEP